ncbi:MarR family transcriptional regulator [Streptomyces halstedii]|uniref:MarR family transcriptional regulator n=1 Tax=Streptomyces halstedii TaxID=1944 RepID=A0ABS6TKR0_STRHA|nr:MarR family transcriptional regulator [Streptomyces halstedii]MBV7668809.1 MarR family transcriptional regulator [Streptomyces halstedii]
MATEKLSPGLPAPAASRPYAKAHHGYGKRTAPGQRPARAADFALLPERERYVAGYVDRLPDGGAMDVKSLAKALPLYGQMAVGSALRALGVAGHLRRVRCQVVEAGQSRWVTRTYWSRTARDSAWWDTFTRNGGHQTSPCAEPAPSAAPPPPRTADAVPSPAPSPAPAEQSSSPVVPQQRTAAEETPAGPSPAYLALARLGRREPRLALSAADCALLEEAAAAWLERGVDTEYLTRALTAGLPSHVDSPVGFVRRRLRDKIPPRLPAAPSPAASDVPVRRVLMECTECGVPGPPEALPDGLCRSCRTPSPEAGAPTPVEVPEQRDIHALVGSLRNLMQAP